MSVSERMVHLTNAEVQDAARQLVERNAPAPVWGVPRGGRIPAALVAGMMGTQLLDAPQPGCLVVDDIIDSGATRERFAEYEFDALFDKDYAPGWLVFPWEVGTEEEAGPAAAVVRLLEYIGEDPNRDGLRDTPRRVLKAWAETTAGYGIDPAQLLGVQFEQDDVTAYQGIVLLRDVPFTSTCEHHMLPFVGTASVAYIPRPEGRVVGLSKLARLVDAYAQRLQVQERMTVQIVNALVEALDPVGAACVVRAEHSCMNLRGIKKNTGGMVTSELRGAFLEDPRAREELMALLSNP